MTKALVIGAPASQKKTNGVSFYRYSKPHKCQQCFFELTVIGMREGPFHPLVLYGSDFVN